jgi:long-chain acyl-CoA synthetase
LTNPTAARQLRDRRDGIGYGASVSTSAVLSDITTARTLGEVALGAARRHSGDALRSPARPPVGYDALGHAVREIAGGLAALGVEAGDRVGILGGTRPEWTLADFGALCAGAVVVPVYHTNSPEECEYVLAHAGVKALILEDATQAAKIAMVRERLPELEHVVVMEGEAEGALTLAELRARGAGTDVADARVAAVAPRDAATIVYTSGTTGPPKGCVLTHANLLAVAGAYIERLDLRARPYVYFQYLPLAHVLARMVQIVALDTGGTLAFWSGDAKRIVEDIAAAEPTHVPTVPRLLEKIQTRALSQAQGPRGQVFRRALATGERVARRRREGRRPGLADRVRHAVGDRLALSKVRAVLGPGAPIVVTGAAPIGVDVLEFFDACGITVLEGYGMTETCAAATLNTPRERRLGSVGRPLPGTEVETADDGEILLRGPHVFAGYHRNQDATDAIMREGGWLATGDLGHVDGDGYLHITGRKKDLVITSSGKNVSPELIESALREIPWVSHAVVAGDRRSYLVALLTLDPDEAPRLAAEVGAPADLAAMASDARVRARIEADVEAINRRFATIEQVKTFLILPRDLSQAEGELTPTLKVKRSVVYDRYATEIARLYGE